MTLARTRAVEPLPLQHLRRGKVREVYIVDDDRLLLVATDRVSAFDVVMNEAIPYKGAVLTQVTAWWLRQLEGDVRHHMLASDVDEIIDAVPSLAGSPCDARRSRDALQAHRRLSGRVRDPRLSLRIGVEGIQSVGHVGGRSARAGPARERTLRPAALQSGDQGRDGPRREHHGRRTSPRSSARSRLPSSSD